MFRKDRDPQQSLAHRPADWQNLLGTKDEFIDTSTPDGRRAHSRHHALFLSFYHHEESIISDARY